MPIDGSVCKSGSSVNTGVLFSQTLAGVPDNVPVKFTVVFGAEYVAVVVTYVTGVVWLNITLVPVGNEDVTSPLITKLDAVLETSTNSTVPGKMLAANGPLPVPKLIPVVNTSSS